MTLEEMLKAHKQIWTSIIEEGITNPLEKNVISRHLGYDFHAGCAACQYVKELKDGYKGGKLNCGLCPFDWGSRRCEDDGTAYTKWKSGDLKSAVDILHIPLKKLPEPPDEVPVSLNLTKTGTVELNVDGYTLLYLKRTGEVGFIDNGFPNKSGFHRVDGRKNVNMLFPAVDRDIVYRIDKV